jgi:hypothetical protein
VACECRLQHQTLPPPNTCMKTPKTNRVVSGDGEGKNAPSRNGYASDVCGLNPVVGHTGLVGARARELNVANAGKVMESPIVNADGRRDVGCSNSNSTPRSSSSDGFRGKVCASSGRRTQPHFALPHACHLRVGLQSRTVTWQHMQHDANCTTFTGSLSQWEASVFIVTTSSLTCGVILYLSQGHCTTVCRACCW